MNESIVPKPGDVGFVSSEETAPAESVAAVKQEVKEAAKELGQKVDEALANVRRVYVAVHGIGDQSQFETIQQVANRLSKFFDAPAGVPLGSFHSPRAQQCGFIFLKNPPYSARFEDVGLGEIYWADIPRKIQKEGHSLEESKKWAATLVARIRMREKGGKDAPDDDDYEMLEQVVGEMIEGIAILDRLLYIADKLRIFKFQLKDLLDSFLGDVQVVTDFEVQRIDLMGQFRLVMDKIRKANDRADIYIVAHSEGTVVAFLALLKAFKEYAPADGEKEEQFGWIKQVKGLLTIGSPIEEHMILWPDLWEDFRSSAGDPGPVYAWKPEPGGKIKWRNYLDNGDPIAYRLSSTAEWIRRNGWGDVFEFDRFNEKDPGRHEIVFSRYLFPGKAHVDYWDDKDVFGHFIETVVQDKHTGQFQNPPSSHWYVGLFSRVVPYLIPMILLLTAVYIMTRATHGFLYPGGSIHHAKGGAVQVDSFSHVSRDVLGISLLLLGISVAARIPRLTRSIRARFVAFSTFLACAAAYPRIASEDTLGFLGAFPSNFFPNGWGWADRFLTPPYNQPSVLGLILAASLLVLLAMWLSSANPRWGAKTLMLPGMVLVPIILAAGIYQAREQDLEHGAIWKVILAEVAFLYLWWLAVILFDLIYVWHHYVRGTLQNGTTMTDRLRAICKDPSSPE